MSFLQGLFGPPNVEQLKAKRDVKGLIKAVGYQKDAYVRKAAAMALDELVDAQAIEPLTAALKDSDRDVRQAATQALVKMYIQALMKAEGSISAVEDEKKAMEKKNPLVGHVGIMLGLGSPPPGLEHAIQAAESRYEDLAQKLSNYRKVEAEWRARLSALTGKNFERASEWDEWFRKEHQ